MERRDGGITMASHSAVAAGRRPKTAAMASSPGAAPPPTAPLRNRLAPPSSATTSPAASVRSSDDAWTAARHEPMRAWAEPARPKRTSAPMWRQPQIRSAPPLARSPSRSRRRSRAAALDGGGGERAQLPPPSPTTSSSHSVWDSFAEHVKGLSTASADVGVGAGFGNSKSSFRERISQTFVQTIARLHEMDLRRTEKAAAAAAAAEAEGKTVLVERNGDDRGGEFNRGERDDAAEDLGDGVLLSDDDDDEDEETRELRRQRALAHWSVVRRHVGEKIRKRKESNTLSQSWNILRQQLRAVTRADKVRRDLYLRYGVLPPDGQRYPRNTMMPSMSERAKEIIVRFEAITLT